MDFTERLGAILRALQITEIEFYLSGGGDSGETTLESVTFTDGSQAHELPDIPVLFDQIGEARRLLELLERIVADAPEGDWVNNEGGHGTVIVRPFEDDEGLVVECDMTFGEEGDDDDYVDDEDEDFNDDTMAEPIEADEDGELVS